jgi:hypothetical protein
MHMMHLRKIVMMVTGRQRKSLANQTLDYDNVKKI